MNTLLPAVAVMQPIYLDYNATTPIHVDAVAAMSRVMTGGLGSVFGNPSSSHAFATPAMESMRTARAQVAHFVGAHPEEIVFCSGGTESVNHILKGLFITASAAGGADATAFPPSRPHMIVSAIEHVAVLECAHWLQACGFADLTIVPVSEEGIVSVEDVMAAVTPATRLVSIMLANNETGALQPIAQLAVRLHASGQQPLLLHTDASQALGKVPVSVSELGVDLLTGVGHKFYAPKGIGFTYVRTGVTLPPLFHGGGQE
ncbi:MAG: aminotransferase class V-fold PLP-dependent enzyme, partial [Methanobacteriota archaeon]